MTTTARAFPRRRRLPRLRPRLLAALAAVLLIAFGAFMWLRTSSLVAVRQIRITGVAGPDAAQIRSALRRAAHRMTTLDVSLGAFHTAVSPYAVVKHVQVSTSFPHGMTIAVSEQVPVAQITAGGRTFEIGSDGTLLHDPADVGPLPTLSLTVAPGGERVTGETAQEVALLAAAPFPLLGHVSGVSTVSGLGLVAQLRSGPKIIFGSSAQAAEKWQVAAAVLADRNSSGQLTAAGADYIDVTDPQRPAAGAGQDTAAGSVAPSASASGTSSTPNPTLPGVPSTAPGGAAGSGATGPSSGSASTAGTTGSGAGTGAATGTPATG